MSLGERAGARQAADGGLPPRIATLLRESGWIAMLLLALYVALILFTFNKGDPGWSHSVAVEQIRNSGGVEKEIFSNVSARLRRRCGQRTPRAGF